MRIAIIAGTSLLGFGAGLGVAGCFDLEDDCTQTLTCNVGTSTTSSSSSSSTGSHVNCDPMAGAVDESCGLFVSSSMGDDGHGGTQAAPLKSLGAALAKAGAGRVYACGEIFTEAVKMTAGATLYGALDCSKGWAYDAQKKTVLTAGAGAVPLTLTSTVVGAKVLDVKVAAADATAAGGSSIAVVADHATATFTRCDLVAGNAGDGTPGMSGGPQAAPADGGKKGDDAGITGTLAGGAGASNAACSLQAGSGGNGGTVPNGNGQDGQPGDNGNGGPKGNGDTGTGCSGNPNGANGMPGTAGPVLPGIGTLDATGYHGVDGQPGKDGTNGTSGGGGGGSKATTTAHGAGGGGGGAGGCAGKYGGGGTAAGSSIALVSVSAKLSLVDCTLGSGKPGNGGDGGDGQFGQPGGQQGNGGMASGGASKGCLGGTGGDGGNGGNGSGGQGGHSFGIAAMGTAPVLDVATKAAITFGTKGAGGKGGNMDADMNHGADGIAAACWDFGSSAACK